MSDNWMIRGTSLGSCNCDWGCPCQFNSPSTHGQCQFASGGHIEEGYLGDVRIDGLNWAEIGWWPGEIAEGNGKGQMIIDERADEAQREAIRKILFGEVGTPGSNHFSIFASTFAEMFDPLYLPIDYAIDVEARTGHVVIPGVLDIQGSPIIDEFSGEEFRVGIHRPSGSFEYVYAEIGNSVTRSQGAIPLEMNNTYGQFNILHYDQNGIVRA
ncbi:MAG: DUF1326 domain-containing protein [bacterium]